MSGGALFRAVSAETRFGRVTGAIVRHAGRGSGDRRNDCYRRCLDDNLRRRRRNVSGSPALFAGGGVGGSATSDDDKRGGKATQECER
jgi:hypothetical protein